ncbi:MAG: hypothetical protein EPN61_02445 [Burkholderiaceae bacterium]|nr:MAG: hypothetical protein EPN61_02445 [Burkholderiaceae bacterium]
MTGVDSLKASCQGDQALAEAVVHAVQTLLERDAYLLWSDVNERTVTHRLAIYVEQAFPGWDVDCEYNRDGHDPKEIAFGSGDDGEHGSRVFPDVIVHKRGTTDNHIVFELKKSNNPESDDRDFEKLRGYCQQLGYRHGVFVRLGVRVQEPAVARAEFVYA